MKNYIKLLQEQMDALNTIMKFPTLEDLMKEDKETREHIVDKVWKEKESWVQFAEQYKVDRYLDKHGDPDYK